MKAIVILLLIVLLLHKETTDAVPVIRSVVDSVPRRSAEYDDYLVRQIRETTDNCHWHTTKLLCTASYSRYDEHKLTRRGSGRLGDVQEQGKCGSCWSFALTGTFTDLRNLKEGTKLSNISPQQMTACERSTKYVKNGNGCCGGYYQNAAYLLKEIGAPTTDCLKYTLKSYPPGKVDISSPQGVQYKQEHPPKCPGTCDNQMPFTNKFVQIKDYTVNTSPTEEAVMRALDKGPIVAGMDFNEELMMRYACGIYCTSKSKTSPILGHHAVEIVDYGTDPANGVNFYVVKNSVGTNWGEKGYFRIKRGDLGLGTDYPIVELSIFENTKQKRALSYNATSNVTFPANAIPTCSAYNIADPMAEELFMIVAKYSINELNDLNSNHSLILCPDNSTTAGQITFSTVTNATTQVVDGTFFNITMMVKVDGCCLTGAIDATIIAEVFRDQNGTFSLSAYTFSTGTAVRLSILLVFGAIALVLLLQ